MKSNRQRPFTTPSGKAQPGAAGPPSYLRYLAGCWLALFLLFSGYFTQRVYRRNRVRHSIAANPQTTQGVITEKRTGKQTHSGRYRFVANGSFYHGETLTAYAGVPGDSICVTYQPDQPDVNLSCADMPRESPLHDGLLKGLIFSLPFGLVLGYQAGRQRRQAAP